MKNARSDWEGVAASGPDAGLFAKNSLPEGTGTITTLTRSAISVGISSSPR